MKVLVFGAGGQIGGEVCRAAWPPHYAVLPLDENAVNITKNAAVTAMLARETPDLAINLAAYTAVDRAESEPEAAWAVNCAGAAHVAAACDESATPLIHLSTDYVFDGRKTEAYLEDDAVSPLNVYGRTGTYHFVGSGAVSWHGFADAIFNLAAPQLTACLQIED